MRALLQGSKKSVLRFPFIIFARPRGPVNLFFLSCHGVVVFSLWLAYLYLTYYYCASSSWVVVRGCQHMLPCFLSMPYNVGYCSALVDHGQQQ
jgi:hypothetical protein